MSDFILVLILWLLVALTVTVHRVEKKIDYIKSFSNATFQLARICEK